MFLAFDLTSPKDNACVTECLALGKDVVVIGPLYRCLLMFSFFHLWVSPNVEREKGTLTLTFTSTRRRVECTLSFLLFFLLFIFLFCIFLKNKCGHPLEERVKTLHLGNATRNLYASNHLKFHHREFFFFFNFSNTFYEVT